MKKLGIEEFGTVLLTTNDLDPIYVMLQRAWESRLFTWEELCDWCLAYWCNYHAGVASWATETPQNLIVSLYDIARNETRRFPRGTERRHFRGMNALRTVDYFAKNFPTAEYFVSYVAGPAPRKFKEVAKRAQEAVGFGPWISFKIADMMERVLDHHVDFSDCMLGVYEEPLQGAVLACKEWGVYPIDGGREPQAQRCLHYAVDRLMNVFSDEYNAPPDYKRAVNVQEIETILCKWKSHMNGHYPLGKDTRELHHALNGWGRLAEQMKAFVPMEVV